MSTGTQWAPTLAAASTQVPAGSDVGMAANETPEEHDIILLNSSGYGVVGDGSSAQAGLRAKGIVYPDKRSTVSTADGGNRVRVWDGYGARLPMKSGDAFTANDVCVPAYLSAAKEIAKSPSASGIGRAIAALMVGLDIEGKAITWGGPIGQLLARAGLVVDNFTLGFYEIVDAAASTAISERAIGFVSKVGVVTVVRFAGAAVASDNTDYKTGTLAKRSAADSYASATTIATFDTRSSGTGAITALTPYSWSLSGTAANLRVVPGDIITLTTAAGGSGKSLVGAIEALGKVI